MAFLQKVVTKTALAVSGLTVMTGLAGAAPAVAAQTAASLPPAVTQVQTSSAGAAPVDSTTAAPVSQAAPDRAVLVDAPQGAQSRFTPSEEQMANARTIVRVAKERGLPDRAAVIAVATALQESKLHNLGHLGERNDHDSQGLFQQRPSSGWGTVEQITDPEYASNAFYAGLEQVDGWQEMPLTEAAQTVQVSAYPDAYAQWEEMAADIVLATYDTGPYADIK
jgi:hypothetical protein